MFKHKKWKLIRPLKQISKEQALYDYYNLQVEARKEVKTCIKK